MQFILTVQSIANTEMKSGEPIRDMLKILKGYTIYLYIYILYDISMFYDVTITLPYAKDNQMPSSQRMLEDVIITCLTTPCFISVIAKHIQRKHTLKTI